MSEIHTLRPSTSAEITSSKINIGCECLDRQMWHLDKAIDALGETGAKLARVQTGWSRCEPEPGKLDFAWLDEVVDAILMKGIQPWFNVTYGNIHYTGAPAPDAVGWTPVYSASALHAWQHYVAELVKHFRDRVTQYEIWNEPDIRVFWKNDDPDPVKYTELVAKTAAVIKRHQPEAYIIGGATANGTNLVGLAYLEKALQAGIGDHIDAFSYHCYRTRPEGQSVRELEALRAQLKRHNVDAHLWQGECGCPSVESKREAMCGIPWTEAKQGKWMLRRMVSDLTMDIDVTTHFHLSDFYIYYKDGPIHQPAYFGLLRNETYERKEAFKCFQSMCSLFDCHTKRDPELISEIRVESPDSPECGHIDWLLTQISPFNRKGHPLLAYWYPAELNPETTGEPVFQPGKIDINMVHLRGMHLANPVLVNPMTHEVQELDLEEVWNGHRLAGLPLNDYPMFITDRAAIEVE